jgi:hypothetical protein
VNLDLILITGFSAALGSAAYLLDGWRGLAIACVVGVGLSLLA